MPNPILGEIRIVAFSTPPAGWASCDGQLLGIATNQALFSLLGTTWGGDGIRTFRLPDLTGQPMVGADAVSQLGPQPAVSPPLGGVQPGLALHFFIALQGSFPSRA